MLKALFYALIFVAPVYCVYIFEIFGKDPYSWLSTLLALGSVVIFFLVPSSKKFWFGFFASLLWFYWVGFSFIYFGAPFLVPVIAIVVACIYMVVFALALWSENPWYRGICLVGLSYIHPFGFDWLVVDSFFAYSYFGVAKYDFFFVVFGIALLLQNQTRRQIVGIALLVCALDYKSVDKEDFGLKYSLLGTHFSQDFKWQRQNMALVTQSQINLIKKALEGGNELIVLPETAFPFKLEKSYFFETLKNMSKNTALIVGSLREGEGGVYNSAYIFSSQKVEIVDKKILAPFGEKIPLPEFLSQRLHHFFLGHSPKMLEGKEFGDIEIGGERVRVLICYEGTSQEAYLNAPKRFVIISNNAWFEGSIQSAVQKMLMKYYAKRYEKMILHTSNGSRSFFLTP